jgi:H+/gluconate symporter-like permease
VLYPAVGGTGGGDSAAVFSAEPLLAKWTLTLTRYGALHRWAALPVLALNALGETYAHLAAAAGIDTALMHRVAAISPGALAMLPHNGAVVTLVAICGATQRGSYR